LKLTIDSGAHRSILNEVTASKLKCRIEPIDPEQSLFLFGPSGDPLEIIGNLTATVKVAGINIEHTFLVIKNLTMSCLLGIDFLDLAQVSIDFTRRTVSFLDNLVTVPLGSNDYRDYVVRSQQSVKIPANTEAILTVTVPRKYQRQLSIIEPLPSTLARQLFMARGLVDFTAGKRNITYCRLMNVTDEDKFIPRGTALATIAPADVIDHVTEQIDDKIHVNNISDQENSISFENKMQTLKSIGLFIGFDYLPLPEQQQLCDVLHRNRDLFVSKLSELKTTPLVVHDVDTGDHPPIRSYTYKYTEAARKEIAKQIAEMEAAKIIEKRQSPWCSPIVLVSKKTFDEYGNKQYRICLDCRKINSISKATFWPMKSFDEILCEVSEAKPNIYSLLDAFSGYNQIPLTERAQERCSFCFQGNQYVYLKTCFGLQSAPFSYSLLISKVLGNAHGYASAYLDDTLCYSNSTFQHCQHLQDLFNRFRAAKLSLNARKCRIGLQKVVFLGFQMQNGSYTISDERIQIMTSFPVPVCLKSAKRFFATASFFKRMIPGFSQITAPIRQLFKKGVKFYWGHEQDHAFKTIIQRLTHPPILAFYQSNKDNILTIDASSKGLGFCFSQRCPKTGQENVVFYGGRATSKTESKYTASELEALALITGVSTLKHMLLGKPLEIRTDHVTLRYLNNLSHDSNPRLLRWSLKLQPYNYTVVYKGSSNVQHVDAISRRTYTDEDKRRQAEITSDVENDEDYLLAISPEAIEPAFDPHSSLTTFNGDTDKSFNLPPTEPKQYTVICIEHDTDTVDVPLDNDDIFVNAITNRNKQTRTPQTDTAETYSAALLDTDVDIEAINAAAQLFDDSAIDIAAAQRESTDLLPIIQYLESNTLSTDEKLARKTVILSEQFTLVDNKLYHFFTPRRKNLDYVNKNCLQLCVPQKYRPDILRCLHNFLSHTGISRLFENLKTRYYWMNYWNDCYEWCIKCPQCLRFKRDTQAKRSPMVSHQIHKPLEAWTIDFVTSLPVGRLPNSIAAYQTIITATENYSGWVEAAPCVTTGAHETLDFLISHIISRFGLMKYIFCDRDPSFTSNLVSELSKLLGIKKIHSSAYMPRSQSKLERYHQTLHQSMRLQIAERADKDMSKWPTLLPYVLYSHRANPVTSSGVSPFKALFGTEMEIPITRLLPPDLSKVIQPTLETVKTQIQKVREIVQVNQAKANELSANYYNKQAQTPSFKLNQRVLVKDERSIPGQYYKFRNKFRGFYVIESILPNFTYRLRDPATNRSLPVAFHASKLRPYDDNLDLFYERCNLTKQQAADAAILLPTDLQNSTVSHGLQTSTSPPPQQQQQT